MIHSEETQKLRHVAIFHELRQRIESGAFAPGDRLPSYTVLRTEFNASEDTIERAYAALEREGMVVRKHRIGTFVARSAGAREPDAKIRQGALGVLIPQQLQNDSYYTRIMNGIQSAARAADIDILLLSESSKPRWEKVDGIVSFGPPNDFPALPSGMPSVSLLLELPDTVCVFNDDEGGAGILTEHLLQLGHRKIGYLHFARLQPANGLFAPNNIGDARLKGYRESLIAAEIRPREDWLRILLTADERALFSERGLADHRMLGRNAMNNWLREGWRELGCTALLAQNDLVAIGVVESLREAGLRVPEDISVAGFDGLEAGDYFTPRLTTVVVPLEAIAARGAELLLDQIRTPLDSRSALVDRAKNRPVVFPCTLRVGESSARKMD